MYLYTLRDANFQYRTLATSEAVCCGADASRAARRVGRAWDESAFSRIEIPCVKCVQACTCTHHAARLDTLTKKELLRGVAPLLPTRYRLCV
jgi:hypothetical protein